uniref:Probable ATP-dependent transporter ycf16 n=1 Tax=Timspurckia oligopyrenoides TaxID=708627 RepID=A0A7S0ZHE1_9RHOD|mmetsp:Transcript_5319/g.9321  ORF Transcript_5319/g.9321 Transcript_5319/m.9321 type:complete len:655 (+) Transcript_5319:164-2128(+)
MDSEHLVELEQVGSFAYPKKFQQGNTDIQFDPFFTEHGEDDIEAGTKATSFEASRKVDLRWEHVGFSVGVKQSRFKKNDESTKKVILKDISGRVEPGQMLAVMGSSGAGKSTLLNLLAGRLTASKDFVTEGQISVNGKKRDPSLFKSQSAYVEQEDKLFAELTVYEQILYSAKLRLPESMPKEKKEQRVRNVIQELGLSHVSDSYIGDENVRGLSGGEKKRVNVGVELVSDPALLFLDEPTSGLDAFNALNVMYTLRQLASRGRSIITTIHQPRSNIFVMFDYLCLLSLGQVVYYGPAAGAVTYFSALQFDCPTQFNPADYFIDLISVDPRNPEAEGKSRKRIEYFAETLKEQQPSEPCEPLLSIEPEELRNVKRYQVSWFSQVAILLGRHLRLITREKVANAARIGQTVFFSVMLGLIWLDVGRQDFSDEEVARNAAFDVGGALFFIIVNMAFSGVFGILFNYPLERAVVLKERSSGTYRVSAYAVAKNLSELPRNALQVLFLCTVTYFMIGFRSGAGMFFTYLYVILMAYLIAEGITLCVSTLLPDPQAAAAIVPVFIIMSMLFGGFLINNATTPSWIGWLRWISFVNYGFQVLMDTQFNCTDCGQVAVEEVFDIEIEPWVGFLALLAMLVFWRVLWYIILRKNGPKTGASV